MGDSTENAELAALGDACLNWLAGDVEELERFMALAGYSPQSLRAALGSTGLAAGLVDYFGRNESQLLAMCANAGIPVERMMRAWHRLNPQS